MLEAIALQDEKTTGLERTLHAFEHAHALWGRGELHEDRCEHVVLLGVPVPGADGREPVIDLGPEALRERLCFREPHRREVEGDHFKPLHGEPHAVSAFAVGDAKRPHTWSQPPLLVGEKSVGPASED